MKWKEVHGFEDYSISCQGNIFSKKAGKELKPFKNHNGYLRISLRGSTRKNLYVHRLVGGAFLVKKEGMEEINHLDGNKLNNSVTNLEWCTPSQNVQHAYSTGITKPAKGILHHNSKLDPEKVKHIRVLRGNGMTLKSIGDKFGISFSHVRKIVSKGSWREV